MSEDELDGMKQEKNVINIFSTFRKEVTTKDTKKLKSSAGSTIEDSKTILNEMKNYYQQLYTSQDQTSPDQLSDFLNSGPLPRLDDVSQNLCEGSITEAECLSAIKAFQRNKTPGTDGLTAEFYLCFWKEIRSCPLIDCLNHGALQGELSISQRQGIISLIPKKDKDLLSLKNWRPISLLNTDYKIATKCIANRLEKVLPLLIRNNQTG